MRKMQFFLQKCISTEQIFIADGYELASTLFRSSEGPYESITSLSLKSLNICSGVAFLSWAKQQSWDLTTISWGMQFGNYLSLSINLLWESLLNLLIREIKSGKNIKKDIMLSLKFQERGSTTRVNNQKIRYNLFVIYNQLIK